MTRKGLTLLAIFIWLLAGLWYLSKVADIGAGLRKPQPIDSVFIRQIDTLKQLEIRRQVLHDSVLVIKTKYDTIFKSIDAGHGFDTACSTTQKLVAMHRFIDSIAGE